MNREELIRIVTWQYALVGIAAILFGILGGMHGCLSTLSGGLCVAVPNSLFALKLLMAQLSRRQLNPMSVLIGEFLKMIVTCMLFVLVAKLYVDLNWPAMIFGIVVAVCSHFVLLFVKH